MAPSDCGAGANESPAQPDIQPTPAGRKKLGPAANFRHGRATRDTDDGVFTRPTRARLSVHCPPLVCTPVHTASHVHSLFARTRDTIPETRPTYSTFTFDTDRRGKYRRFRLHISVVISFFPRTLGNRFRKQIFRSNPSNRYRGPGFERPLRLRRVVDGSVFSHVPQSFRDRST